jgi:hypothetical protein
MSEQNQEQKLPSFAQYKAKLKNEVEIAELRARLATAQATEVAEGNRYNREVIELRNTAPGPIPVEQAIQVAEQANVRLDEAISMDVAKATFQPDEPEQP